MYKGPKLGVCGEMAKALATNVRTCIPERYFCLLSWAFMLRANSEASELRRTETADQIVNRFAPLSVRGG